MSQDEARGSILPIGYAVGMMLLAIPLIELAITASPPQPGVMQWRFGAFGLLANQLLFPLLGFALLLFTASALGHRRLLRTFSLVALVGFLALVGLTGLFALDALQLRGSVANEARVGYHALVGKALANYVIATLTLGWMALVSFRASRSRARSGQARQPGMTVRRAAARQIEPLPTTRSSQLDEIPSP